MSSRKRKGEERLMGEDEAKPPVPPEFQYDFGVYLAMLTMGMGLLTTWNIVLNSIPYFQSLYDGDVGKNIAFYLTCANSYPGLPILFFMVAYGGRFPLAPRIVGSFLLMALIMVLMPIASPSSYWAPLALMFGNGLVLMVLQSSLFGLQAQMPPIMSQAAMGGQGFAGIVASAAQIIVMGAAQSSGRSDYGVTAVAYFSFAAALLVLCAALYVWLSRHPFFKFHMQRASDAAAAAQSGKSGDAESAGAAGGGYGDDDDDEQDGAAEGETRGLVAGAGKGTTTRAAAGGGGCGGCRRPLGVLRKIWRGALGVHLIFVGTFVLFPGVMDSIPYRGGFGPGGAWLASNGWWSVLLLAAFNVFDTVGRMAPTLVICFSERALLPLTLARFGLVVWFLACARSWVSSPVAADVLAVAATAVLGVSNGYLTSLTLMAAPEHAAPHERETAGFLLSLCLNLGIVLGSQIALVLR